MDHEGAGLMKLFEVNRVCGRRSSRKEYELI